MNQQLLKFSFYFVNAVLLCVDILCNCEYINSAKGHSKKSIFPTTDTYRVSDFIDYLFAPVIKTGELIEFDEGSYTCGVASKYSLFISGFELHSAFAPQHESGGLDIGYVESKYQEKWDNLMSFENNGWYYDAILDNNMAFWVTDLATFDGYNEDYIDRMYLKWEWQGKTYYSMIAHNKEYRNDMNQFEFISDTFSTINNNNDNGGKMIDFIRSEPRAYIDDLKADYASFCKKNNVQMVEIGIRKAVSNVEKNVNFYKSTFKGSIIDESSQIHSGEYIDANGNHVKYSHILLQSDDSFVISFFQRNGGKTTFGDFTILRFENEMMESHKNVMINPFCCVDRWYDFHYTMSLKDDILSVLVFDNIMKDINQLYSVFKVANSNSRENPGMFWIIVEPNGQMIQLLGPESQNDKVSIDFIVEPSKWDENWCPQTNSDKFEEFTFGDSIATIKYNTGSKIIDDVNGRTRVIKWSVLIILVSVLSFGLAVCLYLLFAAWCDCHCCCCCKKEKKEKKETSEEISYTYNTFEQVDIHTAN